MKYQHLRVEEREKIQRALWENRSIRWIAEELGRSPSSVAREVNKNFPKHRRQYTPRCALVYVPMDVAKDYSDTDALIAPSSFNQKDGEEMILTRCGTSTLTENKLSVTKKC